MATDFVDRVGDAAVVRDLVDGLRHGCGGAVVFEGDFGSGKTALLAECERRVEEDGLLAGRDSVRVVSVGCRPFFGPGISFGPIIDAARVLLPAPKAPRTRSLFSKASRGIMAAAPDVLTALVPGLGAIWQAAGKAAEAAAKSGSIPADSLQPLSEGVVDQVANALLEKARTGRPLVLMVDDIQFIDTHSSQVLDKLVRAASAQPIAVVLSWASEVVASRPSENTGVDDLLGLWAGDGVVKRLRLTGLPDDAVAELVSRRYPSAAPELAARLAKLTRGQPIFVVQYLDHWRAADGDEGTLPAVLGDVVTRRLRRFDAPVRRLIDIASVQGPEFLSEVVAEVAEVPHAEVLEALGDVADTGLFVLQDGPSWAADLTSDRYRFDHLTSCEVVYKRLSPETRRSAHERIASVLMAGEWREHPIGRLVEAVRHLDLGGVQCVADAAEVYYVLALRVAIEDLSFRQAEEYLQASIACARTSQKSGGRDGRLVRAIELLLSLTEVRWQGRVQPEGAPDIDGLAQEAEAEALRTGDKALIARAVLLRGKTLLATKGLDPSLDKLAESVRRAHDLGDPVALFVARVEYGRQVSKRRLADGLTQLLAAEEMYGSIAALGVTGDPVLQHARNLGEMQLGISMYDNGGIGDGLERLERCVARLRTEEQDIEIPLALNYLAQVYLAVGRWRQAEEALREALGYEERRGGASGWHAYNLALLASIASADPTRRGEAYGLIGAAWAETEDTWLANLVPIVRNIQVEVLLAVAHDNDYMLDEADRQAEYTCRETLESGMVRSRIAAHSLRGRIAMERGRVDAAVDQARTAVEILNEVGDMPALRTEEVLYWAFEALRAGEHVQESQECLARARAVVDRKAFSIDDPVLRRGFLEDVPLNRLIIDATPVD